MGKVYRIAWSRNIRIGVWTGTEWIGIRYKFSAVFLDNVEIPKFVEAGEILGEVPSDIPLKTDLGTLDEETGRECYFVAENTDGTGWWFDKETEQRLPKTARPCSISNKKLFELLNDYDKKVRNESRDV